MLCPLVAEAAYGSEQSPSPALVLSKWFPWCNCGSTVQVQEKSVGPPSTASVASEQVSTSSAASVLKTSSVNFRFSNRNPILVHFLSERSACLVLKLAA
jgi:hypothetical protein